MNHFLGLSTVYKERWLYLYFLLVFEEEFLSTYNKKRNIPMIFMTY